MEVTGKIILVVGETSGVSKSSGKPWKKKNFVLETQDGGSFPRKIAFDLFGDRVDQFPINVGDEITLSFDIESREYMGKWYTDIRGWKVEKLDPSQVPATPPSAYSAASGAPVPPPPVVNMPPVEPANSEDLPF